MLTIVIFVCRKQNVELLINFQVLWQFESILCIYKKNLTIDYWFKTMLKDNNNNVWIEMEWIAVEIEIIELPISGLNWIGFTQLWKI